jgi:hypothetical protein
MVSLNKEQKTIIIVIVVFIIFFILKRHQDNMISMDLRNSTIIVGQVDSIEYTRGMTFVDVLYLYNRRTIRNSFGTYDSKLLDSLKKQTKVLLRVSKRYPEKNIEFICVYKPL